jgi:hypothetical protein
MAIKDEQPNSQLTLNFHTDVPKMVHEALFLDGFYLDAVSGKLYPIEGIELNDIKYKSLYISL